MAILTSPGIKVLEVDNTAFPPTIDSSVVGLVGFASKGPTDIATLITTPDQLIQVFGEPSEDILGQALEGALEILEATDNIYFVRAAGSNKADATASIGLGSCPVVRIQDIGGGFGNSKDFTLHIKAVKQGENETTIGTDIVQFPAGTLNDPNFIKVLQTKLPAGTRVGSRYGIHTFNGDAVLVGYGAGESSYLYVSAFSSVTTYNTTTSANCLTPYVLNTTNVTVSGSMQLGTTNYQVSSWGTTIPALSMKVNSLYPGEGYNYSVKSDGSIVGNGIETDDDIGEYTKITVNDRGVGYENFKVSLVSDNAQYFLESIIPDSDASQSDYIGVDIYSGTTAFTGVNTYIGGFSGAYTVPSGTLIKSKTAGVSVSALTASGVYGTPSFLKLLSDSQNLTGGNNGIPSAENQIIDAVVGDPVAKSGLYALDDDLLNISIAAVPGIHYATVQNNLITLAENSQSFLALVSPSYAEADTVQEVVDWVNGRSTTRQAALNSSWAAVHWPWVQVFSVFDNKDRWYDPVIYAARQMCYTDNVAEPWFAAAGYRRGRLTKPTATDVALSQGDRDILYENNINPIVNFRPEGITIFGQKTLQRISTVLDRINVRRLMIFLRKILLGIGRQYVMEPNDEFTWELIETAINPVLSDIQNRRGLTSYRVISDETVNTPERVARNEMWCKIILQPTAVAEFIVFELNLTSQSAKVGT